MRTLLTDGNQDRIPVIDGVRWDPVTWGETPEAQAALMNALAMSGLPADLEPPADTPV